MRKRSLTILPTKRVLKGSPEMIGSLLGSPKEGH